MRIYHAGGSPIVETTLKRPAIMASAFVDAKKGKPNSRLGKLIALRTEMKSRKRRK